MTELYLWALTGDPETEVCWQYFDDTKTGAVKPGVIHSPLTDELWDRLSDLNSKGAGIFVTVNETDGQGRKLSNIESIRAVFVDDDSGDFAVDSESLPPRSIEVISSPGKAHYYFCTEDLDVDDFGKYQKHIARKLGTDDKIVDPSRVMRCPGFLNNKPHLDEPHLVTVETPDEVLRYTEFEIKTFWGTPPEEKKREVIIADDDEYAGVEYTDQQRDRARVFLRQQASRILDPKVVKENRRNDTIYKTAWTARWLVFSGLLPYQEVYDVLYAAAEEICDDRIDEPILNAFKAPKERSEIFDTRYRVIVTRSLKTENEGEWVEEVFRNITGREEWQGYIFYNGSSHWAYNKGIWENIPPWLIETYMAELDGYAYVDSKNVDRIVNLGSSKIKALAQRSRQFKEIADPEFTRKLRSGVVVGDQVIYSYGADIIQETVTPNHRAFMRLDRDLEDTAPPENFLRLLDTYFGNDPEREQKIQLLREFYGVAMLGSGTDLQKCLILLGNGSNGKGTLMSLFKEALFDPNGVRSLSPDIWGKETVRAQFEDAFLNSVTELPNKNTRDNHSFKSIVTGDAVTVRKLYGDHYVIEPKAAHIFSANQLPPVSDLSYGFWRRFMILEFTQEIDGLTVDEVRESVKDEKSRIFNWALEGARAALARRRFDVPESSVRVMKQWKTSEDTVASWVEEMGFEADLAGEGIMYKDLYSDYKFDMEDSGFRPENKTTFGKRLEDAGFVKKHSRKGNVFLMRRKEDGDMEQDARTNVVSLR